MMTTSRAHRPFKSRTGLYCLVIFSIIAVIYYHQSNQAKLQILKHSEQRCLLGQELLSSQLQVVTDYKGRIEQNLAAEKMEHSRAIAAIRTRQQGEMDSLRQHHSLLQSQFDDLTVECTKVRDAVKTDRDSLSKYVKSLTEEQSIKKGLQKKLDAKSQETVNIQSQLNNLIQENEKLKRQMEILSKDNHGVSLPSIFLPQDNISMSNNKNISKQVAISNDIYLISVNSDPFKTDVLPEPAKLQSTPTIPKKQFKSQSIPEGVAPELMVNEDFNVKTDTRVENHALKSSNNHIDNMDAKPLNNIEDQPVKNSHNSDKSKHDMNPSNLKMIPQNNPHGEDELFKLDNDVNLDFDISNVIRKNGNDQDFNDANNNLDHVEPAAQNNFDGDDEEPDEYGAHREVIGHEPVIRN